MYFSNQQSSFISSGIAPSTSGVSFKAKIESRNGSDDQGSKNNLILKAKKDDKLSDYNTPDDKVLSDQHVAQPKSYIEVGDDDILMPEVNNEPPRVTTTLLEKFNENKSPILV